MSSLVAVVVLLVVFGSLLAIAESSISRMNKAKAMALREGRHRNAALLEKIETDPAPYLNSIYLAVMGVQNGSAILVAMLAERHFGELGIAIVCALFTIAYFVIVEAMSKTFGILHSVRAALAVAPVVWFLGRALSRPTRLLIGLANLLLPGKGLKQGPFVAEQEIRSLAEVGHEEGLLAREEKELIHSVFEFGDAIVRHVMVPRLDIVAIEASRPLREAEALVLQHGVSRVPVYRQELDRLEGIIYAKDVLRALHEGKHATPVVEVSRPARFVPETKRVADLLRDMQQLRFHMAIVTDEYGSVVGLVTLEDLLEELVGEIADEHDVDEPQIQRLDERSYRASGRLPIAELNELLDVDLPKEEWTTIAGLMLGQLGAIPREGQEVQYGQLCFKAEKVRGLRVATVLITRSQPAADPAGLPHRSQTS